MGFVLHSVPLCLISATLMKQPIGTVNLYNRTIPDSAISLMPVEFWCPLCHRTELLSCFYHEAYGHLFRKSLMNVVVMAVFDFYDAWRLETVSHSMFVWFCQSVKLPAKTPLEDPSTKGCPSKGFSSDSTLNRNSSKLFPSIQLSGQ